MEAIFPSKSLFVIIRNDIEQWQSWNENLRGAGQTYGILNLDQIFSSETQLCPQTFKTIISVLKVLYPVQFNPLSYVACYVGTCCHIWSIIVNKNQQFYNFDCYKSFTLIKTKSCTMLRKRVDPNIFCWKKVSFLEKSSFFGKKIM